MVGGDENDSGLFSAMGVPESQWERMRGESVLDIWPENWDALQVFSAMLTQWRVGFSGPTGLDYTALPVVMDLIGITQESRAECFEGVRTMENEALGIYMSKRNSG